jgi:Co/Zn/Cd efflux system component
MQSQAQRSSRESYRESYYFVLPAEKQPTLGFQRSSLVKWGLVLLLMVAMALVALSLGLWWDSIALLSN